MSISDLHGPSGPDHIERLLSLWGRMAREDGTKGYPKQVPWYRETGYRELHPDTPPEEYERADQIGRIVKEIGKRYPEREGIAIMFYGASPTLQHTNRADRMKLMNMSKGKIYREIEALKRMIEGALLWGH